MLLELTDSAVMPNLYRSGIKRCFVTANATGELASERVLIRLDRLSCIDENGGAVKRFKDMSPAKTVKRVFVPA